MAQVFLQFAHLGADGLDGHVQPFGGPGKAAFLGNQPEVIQVSVVQHVLVFTSVFSNLNSLSG
ncbi:hypothetical protein D3C78_1757100 [compost metagenome]